MFNLTLRSYSGIPLPVVFLLLLTAASTKTNAQVRNPLVRGSVEDSTLHLFLEEATIALFPTPGIHTLAVIRNGRGGFRLRVYHPGSYRLIATYQGYEPDTLTLSIKPGDSTERVVRFYLQRSVTSLTQVIVKAKVPPVTIHSDTLVFNADAFATRPYASLEDLLRKLPGIEIDQDGNVTMQGKKIDKILLNGKEFFLGNIKAAIQDLPADIVAQVESFDTRTIRGRLAGIHDNTGGSTLNIKLKNDRKHDLFGKIYAGAGNDQGYALGGTATSLGDTRWISVSGKKNNINDQFTGREQNIGQFTNGLLTRSNADFEYKDKLGRLDATVTGDIGSSLSVAQQSSGRQTFFGDSSLLERRLDNNTGYTTHRNVEGQFEYPVSHTLFLTLNTHYSPTSGSTVNNDTVSISTLRGGQNTDLAWLSSRGRTNNNSVFHGSALTNNLVIFQFFKKTGRYIGLDLRQSSGRQSQSAGLYSLLDAFDSLGNTSGHTLINQRSQQQFNEDGYNAQLSYSELLDKQAHLDLAYDLNTVSAHTDKKSFDYDSSSGHYDLPDTLTSNLFVSHSFTQHLHAIVFKEAGRLFYRLGFNLQLTEMNNDNYSLHNRIRQHFTNWFPTLNLGWTVPKLGSFILNYTGTVTAPTIDQLQPLPDLKNPYLVKLGNPLLQQSFQHALEAHFQGGGQKGLQRLFASVSGEYIRHAITAATILLPGGIQQLQYINIEGNYDLSSGVTYGFPLWAPQSNGSFHLNGQYNHENGMLNGHPNSTDLGAASLALKLSYHPENKLFLDVDAALDYKANAYSLSPAQNTQTFVQKYTVDLSYELPWTLTMSGYYSWQRTGAQGALPSFAASYWNMACYKSFFRDHSGQLHLSVFNLLNSAGNLSQSSGPGFIGTQRSNTRGRLWLLSFVWNFRKSRPVPQAADKEGH